MKQSFLIISTAFINFYFLSCSNVKVIDTKEKVLSVVDIPSKNYKLKLVYQPSNATIQSSIQVRKLNKENVEEVIQDYERYNFMDSYKLINDSTFMIVVRDTISYLGNHPDTMFLKLK